MYLYCEKLSIIFTPLLVKGYTFVKGHNRLINGHHLKNITIHSGNHRPFTLLIVTLQLAEKKEGTSSRIIL